ncbi:MAG: glycine-rich protein [Bacteroidota bacterium]
MNYSLRISLLISLSLISLMAVGQGAAVNNNGSAADPSAIFDVSSTTQGQLAPRMTTAQRNAIINPAEGLFLFNLTTGCFNYWHNYTWFEWCGNCIPPNPPTATNNGGLCSGDTLKLFATLIPNATYTWSGPNGFSSTAQNPIIFNADISRAGTYTVYATVGSCSTANSTTNVAINLTPSSAYTFSPTIGSLNSNVVFSPSVTGATYSWTFQSGSPASSTAQNPAVQWAQTGTFNTSLSVTINGCTSVTTTNPITINLISHGSQTFTYTGTQQSWTVPAGVTSVTIDAYGGQGGQDGNTPPYAGSLGGRAQGALSVSGGSTLFIYVGASGDNGGYNGGGVCQGGWAGGKGGGASDVRYGGTTLGNRVIVAGGAGGNAGYSHGFGGWQGGVGGIGGGLTGTDGQNNPGNMPYPCGGIGGSQSGGGANGCNSGTSGFISGVPGTLGQGGNGSGESGNTTPCGNAGSGGGGYYGGGGGGWNNCGGGGGGGGSSYIGGVTGGSTTSGVNTGNGSVTLTW